MVGNRKQVEHRCRTSYSSLDNIPSIQHSSSRFNSSSKVKRNEILRVALKLMQAEIIKARFKIPMQEVPYTTEKQKSLGPELNNHSCTIGLVS